MVHLRLATDDDAARLYSWRLDPVSVTVSPSPPPASFKAHREWFATVRATPAQLFIATDSERSAIVGMVRLDPDGDGKQRVSIIVDAAHRGRGYAEQMLAQVVGRAASVLVADIKDTNLASLRLFWGHGFRGDTVMEGVMRLERPA